MSNCRGPIVTLALAFVSTSLLAQSPPQRDPQAITLLQQSLTAMNGNPGLGALVDLTIEADLIDMTDAARTTRSMRVLTKGPRAIRWEIQGPEGQTVSLFLGGHAVARKAGGDEHALKRRNADLGVAQLPIFYMADVLTSPNLELRMGETVVKDGQTLDRLIVRRPSADPAEDNLNPKRSQTELFIDRATLLPVRLTLFVNSRVDIRVSFPLDIIFSDFRQVDGRLIPFVIATTSGTTTIQEIRVRTVIFNTGVSDSLFQ